MTAMLPLLLLLPPAAAATTPDLQQLLAVPLALEGGEHEDLADPQSPLVRVG